MIRKENVETAYCFFHQKQRVFQYSNMDWQKEDIEYAIASYLEDMNPELYACLSEGKDDYLKVHASFGEDLLHAVNRLEALLKNYN